MVTVKSGWVFKPFFNFGLFLLLPEFFPVDLDDWLLFLDPAALLFFLVVGLGEPTGWLIEDRCTDPSDCLLRAYGYQSISIHKQKVKKCHPDRYATAYTCVHIYMLCKRNVCSCIKKRGKRKRFPKPCPKLEELARKKVFPTFKRYFSLV